MVAFNIKSAADFKGKDPVRFIAGQDPDKMNPIQFLTYKRTYAWAGEFWSDICLRCAKGITANLVAYKFITEAEADAVCEEYYNSFFDMKILPPGRGLKFMGTETPKSKGAGVLVNCLYISTAGTGYQPFLDLVDMSMLGCGVGFDSKFNRHIIKPSNLHFKEDKTFHINYGNASYYTVPDTREGWLECYRFILAAFFEGRDIPEFNFSKIRAEGTPLGAMGGTASGPEPLKLAIKDLISTLASYVGGRSSARLTNDICCILGRATISGGVRRTALLADGELTDETFVNLKLDKERHDKWGWASNNTAYIRTAEDCLKAVELNIERGNGDPGFAFVDNIRNLDTKINLRREVKRQFIIDPAEGRNPCGEIPLESYEVCNINEMLAENIDSKDEFIKLSRLAYMYCKVITCMPFHIKKIDAKVKQNRRIGIGQTGIKRAIGRHGQEAIEDWFESAYIYISNLDDVFSQTLGIPSSIRLTTVKPSGTVSIVANTSAGIHSGVAEYYIRRICVTKSDPLVKSLIEAGYHVEDSVYYPNTVVASIPMHDPFSKDINKQNESVLDQIEWADWIQNVWSDNSVSVTVNFRPDEHDALRKHVPQFMSTLKSLTLQADAGGGVYQQLPEEVTTKDVYEEMAAKIKKIQITTVLPEVNGYCDSERCYSL